MDGHGADIFRQSLVLPQDRTIVAYDDMTWLQIRATAQEVGEFTGLGKTNSAHVRFGSDPAVRELEENGQEAMIDSKFHDIPKTVELSVREATMSGASLITVHAAGGLKMLDAAIKGAETGRRMYDELAETDPSRAKMQRLGHVLGITVLTSLEDEAYSIFGLDPEDTHAIVKKVLEFAQKAKDTGLTGIVCSPYEARAVRENPDFDNLLVVTPAITPRYAIKAEDQARSTNAYEAIRDGADLIVVGRGINQARNYGLTKLDGAKLVAEEVNEGLQERMAA